MVFAILLISVLSMPYASQPTFAQSHTSKTAVQPTDGRSSSAVPLAAAPGTTAPSVSAKDEASTPTGVIVPLYSYPGNDWDIVIHAKQANPSVPIIVVINPSNGPGATQDKQYVSGVDKLSAAGITVLGYVPTTYAARSSTAVIADVNTYKAWYAVNGVFFDEMSSVPGDEVYYSSLSAYAKSIGLSLTFGNPGASVPSSFVGTVDCIVVYESLGWPNPSSLPSWTMGKAKNNFASIAYGVNQLDPSSMTTLSNHVAYAYVTDKSLPNPYGALPAYFASLISSVDVIAPATVALTVQSASMTGDPIAGQWTEIRSNLNVVASGYSPITHNAQSGAQFVVSVSNHRNYIFDHWEDGSTNPTRTVTPTRATTLVAYFKNSTGLTVTSVSRNETPLNASIPAPSIVQISFTNYSNATLTALVYGILQNSAGQIIGYSFPTIPPASGQSASTYLFLDGLSPGTYSVTIMGVTTSGLSLSASATVTIEF